MLSVRLRPSLEEKLIYLAQKTHRSRTYYVQEALESFLEEKGEALLAAAAYEDYLKSGGKGLSLDDMKKKYLNDDLAS